MMAVMTNSVFPTPSKDRPAKSPIVKAFKACKMERPDIADQKGSQVFVLAKQEYVLKNIFS